LEEAREMTLTMPFTLELHGESRELSAEVIATLDENNIVSVTSIEPVVIGVEDFDLGDGLMRLEDAFYGVIRPTFPVSFKFVFRAYETDLPVLVGSSKIPPEVCEARLSEASTTGRISFEKGSHDVAGSSEPTLKKVVGIVNECEGLTITVEGHTDSVGSENANQTLSERRAGSVAKYLVKLGLPKNRVNAEGRGEASPIAPNDTAVNRAKNRRIEFHVDPQT